jgi:putative heme-binding domain-containing protein
VTSGAAAEFLVEHLERTRFSGERAGEFARQAVQHLPGNRFDVVRPLLESLQRAPASDRLALAEGLATVAMMPGRSLPIDMEAWMHEEILSALTGNNAALAGRAVKAVKPLSFPGKPAALGKLVRNPAMASRVQLTALQSLPPDDPGTEPLLIHVLRQANTPALQRTAAQVLAETPGSTEAMSALIAALPSLPAEAAVWAATALGRNETGAVELLDLAKSGRVPTALLRHRYVATALEKRSAPIRERAAALTRALPPEDARLDAIITERLDASAQHKPDVARGAALFAQHCNTCHRFRDAGGNLGPSLDGIASRGVARLLEDILDPSRNIDPSFRLVTVTLKNGETKSGMNHRLEGDGVLLTDPGTGENIEIPRAEVADVSVTSLSAMPAAFETALSAPELLDVISFLGSPAPPGQPSPRAGND